MLAKDSLCLGERMIRTTEISLKGPDANTLAGTLFRKLPVPSQAKVLVLCLTPAVGHVPPILEVLGYHLIESAIIVPDQEI